MQLTSRSGHRLLALTLPLALAAVTAAPGCVASRQAQRYHRAQVQAALSRLETPGLVIGEFPLAGKAVIDGDTIRVEGLDASLRLLAIDTEEIYHHRDRQRMAETDWAHYLPAMRGKSLRPVKTGTPLGVEAMHFAEHFFEGVKTVRLERDDPKEIRGYYGRYLAYVFAFKNGRWINYNLEAVRAGMAPYFTKYSYSRRFNDEFVAAEKEAKAAQRGIWAPGAKHYSDYPEREAWWNARAEFIKKFEHDAQGRDDFIALTHWDAIQELDKKVGQEVTVLGTVGKIVLGDRGPTRVMLTRRMFNDLPVIFFDKDVFRATGLARYTREFVRITGVVNVYQNKYNHKKQLQILVNLPSQVVLSDVPGLNGPVRAAASSR